MNTRPPRAVVFDLGKVLLDFDYSLAIDRLAGRARLAPEKIRELLSETPLLAEYETGRMTSEAFFGAIRSASGYEGSLDEFRDGFADIFREIEPMIELHARIRRGGFPTYVLSNTNELAIDFIRREYPFFAEFDGYVLSYEHGAMKPETKLYELVEKMCGFQGGELFYLDDMKENVEAALARGWRAVVHDDPDKTRTAVREAGLLKV